MKQKMKEFIAVLMIQLALAMPFYALDAQGLSISNVQVTKITADKVTVEWTTDEIAKGKVRYGETSALGIQRIHDNFATDHQLILESGIKSDTNFFFVVESTDQSGSVIADNNSNSYYTFRTPDITPPQAVTGLKIDAYSTNTISLSWNPSNEQDVDHYVIYRGANPVANSSAAAFIDNVLAKSGPTYRVSAVDSSGNEGASSNIASLPSEALDNAAPVITNVNVASLTDTSAKVTWSTDEESGSEVLYGINKTDKPKKSNELVKNHTVIIDGLQKNLEYSFLVRSCDAAGNCANVSGGKFVSLQDLTAPFINVTLPRYVNRKFIDIAGSVEPFSSITLFVNDMGLPVRSLGRNEIGSQGKFIFAGIQLSQSNVVKFLVVDPAGNRNEKKFDVGVDIDAPVVNIDELPQLLSKPNFTISGNSNEQVTAKVFIDTDANGTSIPSAVTGLNATKVSQNSVELEWDENEEGDFSHYVVYRNNEAIAVTKPANFNLFVDALADSGRTYSYAVSAVNIFANEGKKSESLEITTLKGGSILNLKYAPIDKFEDFRKPMFTGNFTGNFKFPIKLAKGNGVYNLKIIFEDRAGNSVFFDRKVKLDTEKPTVKITSPRPGAFIFENVANEIDVAGITKPNARVHLFVDRTPFSFFNDSFQVSGLPNEPVLPRVTLDIPKDALDELPEPQLDAKCRSSVSTSFCRTGADFSVDADSSGNFKFENVDLTAIFGGAGRIREVPLSDFKDELLNQELKDSKSVSLLVIVTDTSMQRAFAKHDVRIGTCWSGNQSWDIIPLTQYQRPAFLSTERMAEGTEVLKFYFNYTYIGPGYNVATGPPARIQRVSIQKACGTRELLDPRFNISCQIMPSGNSPKLLNPPENTVSYSELPISRLPGMDRFLEDDWKSFFKAVNNEMTFPLKVTIHYQHDNDNDGQLETERQTTCEQVSYVLDNTLIDPRKVLPDWLLYDAVDFLQSSIEAMEDVQEQVNRVLEYAAIGCMTSFALVFAVGAYRRYVVFADEQRFSFLNNAKEFQKALDSLTGIFSTNPMKTESSSDEEQKYCQELVKQIAKEKKRFSMKYVTDADLKKCFPSSANAWSYEENVYNAMRWSCDRVFGHASPAGWTANKKDGEILNKVSSAETCGSDQAERGQPLRPERCIDLAKRFNQLKRENFGDDDICFRLETKEGVTTYDNFYMRGQQVEGNLYHLITFEGISRNKIDYVKKITENTYLTASRKSCEELCGITPDSKTRTIKLGETGKSISVTKDPKDKNDKKRQNAATCVTVDQCRSFNQNKQIPDAETGENIKIQSAYSAGYSVKTSKSDQRPCFYTSDSGAKVVSDSPREREECCCINSAGDIETHYYAPDDIDPVTKKPIHESGTPGVAPAKYEDMKFSYRYYKDRFEATGQKTETIYPISYESEYTTQEEYNKGVTVSVSSNLHYEYNPNRYIEGRDFTACFGQNSWWDGGAENTVMVNPLREHLSAIQCVNIGGVAARLQMIKNFMSHFSTCLIQVRTSGAADAGVCKELFTQYICSGLWQALRWFIDGCSPTIDILDTKKFQDSDILAYVRGGLRGTYQSLTDLQSTISSEYGNAKLNEFFGLGEESLARKICLAAFGYDWELSVKNFVDAAYSQPYATLVQPVTRSREFLSVEPQTFRPQYEYRSSWLISPGCDFERYDVYLSCVGRKQLDKYANNVNCGALGSPSIAYTIPVQLGPSTGLGPSVGYAQCDCIGLPDEKPGPVVYSGRLKSNILEDKSIPPGKRVVTDNYRFDHLKFVLRTDRKIPSNLKTNCFPTGYDEGIFYFPLIDRTARDIIDCRADPASGSFTCSGGELFGAKKGTANILSILINGQNPINNQDALTFFPGDSITVDTEIRNVGSQKCLRVTLDGVPEYEIIDEGIRQYSLTHSKQLMIGTSQLISQVPGISIKDVSLGNVADVTISVMFVDTSPINEVTTPGTPKFGDGIIRLDEDVIIVQGEIVGAEALKNGPVVVQSGMQGQTEVSIVDGNLRLKSREAEVDIFDVQIPRSSDGITAQQKSALTNSMKGYDKLDERLKKPQHRFDSVSGTFRVQSRTRTQEQSQNIQSQPKRLSIELFHMKDGADASSFPDSCNPNDAVRTIGGAPVKKDITLKVESKQSNLGTALPKPAKPKLEPSYRKDDVNPITITTLIASSLVGKATLTCTRPDGTGFSVTQNTPNKDNWEFIIGPSEITFAGRYSCDITAEGKNPRATPSSQFFSFEVECGPESRQYGACIPLTGLCRHASGTYIDVKTPGLKCYQTALPADLDV